jgi:hypothetical protein
MNFEIGHVFRGAQVVDAPAGSVLVNVEKNTAHIRSGGMYIFTDETSSIGTFKLVSLPESNDLTDREQLARKLQLILLEGEQNSGVNDNWRRLADFVLKEFTHKTQVPLRVGDRVKLVERDTVLAHDIPLGTEGEIVGDLDSDGEYDVDWDNGYFRYVKPEQIERVS